MSDYSSSAHPYNDVTNSHPATSSFNSSPINTNTNTSTNTTDLKNSVINTASQAMNSVQNHPATQQAKDTIVNGPVGQAVQNQSAKTSSEFQDLADARQTPDATAATGQPLTHYHSLFYRLLSWKNPRATSIVFLSLVSLIFASRYLNVLRYTLKGLYTVLGVTALAEGAGKAVTGNGLVSSFRPKQYYTIRKESLETFLDDIEQLINFAVIEFQRIIFVENIWVTTAAFASSFISYFLIKWLPFWGLTLIGTSVTFLGPLVYVSNKEFIDHHINHAGNVINSQAHQVRDLAAQHTSQAGTTIRSYAGDYSNKASQLINDARGKVSNGTTGSTSNTGLGNSGIGNSGIGNSGIGNSGVGNSGIGNSGNPLHSNDFPSAPKVEPKSTPLTSESQPAY